MPIFFQAFIPLISSVLRVMRNWRSSYHQPRALSPSAKHLQQNKTWSRLQASHFFSWRSMNTLIVLKEIVSNLIFLNQDFHIPVLELPVDVRLSFWLFIIAVVPSVDVGILTLTFASWASPWTFEMSKKQQYNPDPCNQQWSLQIMAGQQFIEKLPSQKWWVQLWKRGPLISYLYRNGELSWQHIVGMIFHNLNIDPLIQTNRESTAAYFTWLDNWLLNFGCNFHSEWNT